MKQYSRKSHRMLVPQLFVIEHGKGRPSDGRVQDGGPQDTVENGNGQGQCSHAFFQATTNGHHGHHIHTNMHETSMVQCTRHNAIIVAQTRDQSGTERDGRQRRTHQYLEHIQYGAKYYHHQGGSGRAPNKFSDA
eukprot:scaffold41448_cov199-Amphora_coffeaeformis.AAC.5